MPPPLVMVLKKDTVDKVNNDISSKFTWRNAIANCNGMEKPAIREINQLQQTFIFPTPLWIYHSNEEDHNLLKKVEKWAYKLQKQDKGRQVSNVDGWQSHSYGDIQNQFWFTYLQTKINGLPSFEYQNYWVSINTKGSLNLSHTHPGSDLSLVWYITDTFDSGITFVTPEIHSRYSLYSTIALPEEVGIHGNRGDIIIFPSDLVHNVEKMKQNEKRISISMNLTLNCNELKALNKK